MLYKKNEISDLELPIFMGIDDQKEEIYGDLARICNLLVIGDTGTGKTMWLINATLSLIDKYRSDVLRLGVIDTRFVDFYPFENLKHLMWQTGCNSATAIERFKEVEKEIEERYRRMASLGVRNLAKYNEKSKDKMPYIVCIIDEIAEPMVEYPKETTEFFDKVIGMGRAAGVFLLASTKEIMPEVMSPKVRLLFKNIIAYYMRPARCDTDYMKAYLEEVEPYTLENLGDHIYKNEYEPPVKLSGRFVDDETIEKIANAS